MSENTIYKDLARIQKELKAPKNQYNGFGKYNYRNCEDILEGLKACLDGCIVLLNDKIVSVDGRFYIEATATLINESGEKVSCSALARESDGKKGMDDSQVTGSSSSYARKYALNGLFAIDDNKDADDQGKKKSIADEKLIKHNKALADNFESVSSVKAALASGDFETAAESMAELDEEARLALNLAPTKGGIWSIDESKLFKSNEYAEARNRYYEEKNNG